MVYYYSAAGLYARRRLQPTLGMDNTELEPYGATILSKHETTHPGKGERDRRDYRGATISFIHLSKAVQETNDYNRNQPLKEWYQGIEQKLSDTRRNL